MKIISKFKDYYDSASYSRDIATGLYERFQKDIPVDWIGLFTSQIGGNHPFELRTGLIGFCGNLYPFVKYTRINPDSPAEDYHIVDFIYSFEQFNELRTKLEKDTSKRKRYRWYGRNDIFRGWSHSEDNGKLWFNQEFTTLCGNQSRGHSAVAPVYVKPKELFIEYKVPCFVLEDFDMHPKDARFGKFKLTLNPCLKDYNFYRIYDAFTTNFKIEMFINNQIVRPDDPHIDPVSDKIKAESHGYDKFSFRRSKGKSK